jgi:hypothetical protein
MSAGSMAKYRARQRFMYVCILSSDSENLKAVLQIASLQEGAQSSYSLLGLNFVLMDWWMLWWKLWFGEGATKK